MPKRLLVYGPGTLHFVTFSTYQRRRFLEPDRTRSIVVETLSEMLERHGASCHGFVVMPDHVHALLTVREDSTIADFLKVWKKTSSYRIGRFYEQELTKYRELCPRKCPVWQARYYDFNVFTTRKHVEKLKYIHRNPVTRGLVKKPKDWAWSSFVHYSTGAVGVVEIESWWTNTRREPVSAETHISKARYGAPSASPEKEH